MQKFLRFILAAALAAAAGTASAQRVTGEVKVAADSTIAVRITSNSPELQSLALLAFSTHGAYDVTPEGEQALAAIGVDVNALRNGRRRFDYGCMDWSERRPHLAGALGAAVAERCIALGWLARQKHSRALNMTEVGQRESHAWLRTA